MFFMLAFVTAYFCYVTISVHLISVHFFDVHFGEVNLINVQSIYVYFMYIFCVCIYTYMNICVNFYICDTEAQNLSFLAFLFNHVLHCICFKIQSLLRYSEIVSENEELYSVSNKTTRIKIGLQLYDLWQIDGHQRNWRIANLKTPISYLGL